MHAIAVTIENYEQEVVQSPVPVLVDFWAPWCVHCRRLAPALDRLAAQWEGKIKVVKIDVDESPALAEPHGLELIPTLFLVQQGSFGEEHIVAPSSQAQLSAWVQAQLEG